MYKNVCYQLATMVKVMMMDLGNNSQEGGALERHRKAKVSDLIIYKRVGCLKVGEFLV